MPKYLLQKIGTPDQNVHARISTAWLDGCVVAGSQLSKHPIEVSQDAQLTFNASLNLPSWMRLAGRSLRTDVIAFMNGNPINLSSSPDLTLNDCLVYDTDKPWADKDPMVVDASGVHAPLLPTTPRPQPATPSIQPQANGSAVNAVQDLMNAANLQPLPIGTAAVSALLSHANFTSYDQSIHTNPSLVDDVLAEVLWQGILACGYFPTESSGIEEIAKHYARPLPDHILDGFEDMYQSGAGQTGPAQSSQTQQMMQQAAQIASSIQGAPTNIVFVPPSGTVPAPMAVSQMASSISAKISAMHTTPAQATGAFTGPTWYFGFIDDPDGEEAGLTSVVIAPAAEWRATGALPKQDIMDLIGDDLPDCLVEESSGVFVSEETSDYIREELNAAGIFEEKSEVGFKIS